VLQGISWMSIQNQWHSLGLIFRHGYDGYCQGSVAWMCCFSSFESMWDCSQGIISRQYNVSLTVCNHPYRRNSSSWLGRSECSFQNDILSVFWHYFSKYKKRNTFLLFLQIHRQLLNPWYPMDDFAWHEQEASTIMC